MLNLLSFNTAKQQKIPHPKCPNLGEDYIVTSGLRTETTNANTEGAVKNSRHKTEGAADITIPNVPADYLAKLGLYLPGGGVGWYPNRHFVHVDDWKQRYWKG